MIKNDVAVIGIGLGGTKVGYEFQKRNYKTCLLYTSPSPRDWSLSRMPSSA